jgi:cytochrome d ubiquinol oxidase subunit I
METDSLNAARVLMGDSLGFHIIFVMFGIGLPVIFSLLEFIGIRYKKPRLIDAAKFISYIATVLVVTGVASGTIIAIQISLMWPRLAEFGSGVIGLPFMFEGYAFILEALFLGYYMYTWDKIKGYRHWVLSLPIILGALLSAFFITSVNSWMNKPGGFDYIDGKVVNPDVWAGIFTPTTFFMVSHSVLGYYLAIFLTVIAGYAWYLAKHRPKGAAKKTAEYIIVRFAIIAFVIVLGIGAIGHFQTQYLAKSQPRKLAAIELVAQTGANQPYIIGGELSADGATVEGGIRIPNGLSILTGNSPNTEIKGLNEFPKEDWPNLIVNKLFESKMLLVSILIAVPAVFLVLYRFRRKIAFSRPMLFGFIIAAPIAFIVIELGWMVTELGRQPFVVNGYLRTSEAFVNNPGIIQWGYIFPALFVILFIVTVLAVRAVIKHYSYLITGEKQK